MRNKVYFRSILAGLLLVIAVTLVALFAMVVLVALRQSGIGANVWDPFSVTNPFFWVIAFLTFCVGFWGHARWNSRK